MLLGRALSENETRTRRWFAWRPVQLDSGEWVWLEMVTRITTQLPNIWGHAPVVESYKR